VASSGSSRIASAQCAAARGRATRCPRGGLPGDQPRLEWGGGIFGLGAGPARAECGPRPPAFPGTYPWAFQGEAEGVVGRWRRPGSSGIASAGNGRPALPSIGPLPSCAHQGRGRGRSGPRLRILALPDRPPRNAASAPPWGFSSWKKQSETPEWMPRPVVPLEARIGLHGGRPPAASNCAPPWAFKRPRAEGCWSGRGVVGRKAESPQGRAVGRRRRACPLGLPWRRPSW